MPSSPNRKRIEIDAEVYAMLDNRAEWLHIPIANLATMLIREGIHRYDQTHRALLTDKPLSRNRPGSIMHALVGPTQETDMQKPAQANLRGADLRRYIEEHLDPGAELTGDEDAGETVAELDTVFRAEGGAGITAQQMDWYLSYKRSQR